MGRLGDARAPRLFWQVLADIAREVKSCPEDKAALDTAVMEAAKNQLLTAQLIFGGFLS